MSDHVEHEHLGNWRVPFLANGPVEVARPAERIDENHWSLAAVIVGSTVALYVLAIGALYLVLAAVL
jgi:hypothetical protein